MSRSDSITCHLDRYGDGAVYFNGASSMRSSAFEGAEVEDSLGGVRLSGVVMGGSFWWCGASGARRVEGATISWGFAPRRAPPQRLLTRPERPDRPHASGRRPV